MSRRGFSRSGCRPQASAFDVRGSKHHMIAGFNLKHGTSKVLEFFNRLFLQHSPFCFPYRVEYYERFWIDGLDLCF